MRDNHVVERIRMIEQQGRGDVETGLEFAGIAAPETTDGFFSTRQVAQGGGRGSGVTPAVPAPAPARRRGGRRQPRGGSNEDAAEREPELEDDVSLRDRPIDRPEYFSIEPFAQFSTPQLLDLTKDVRRALPTWLFTHERDSPVPRDEPFLSNMMAMYLAKTWKMCLGIVEHMRVHRTGHRDTGFSVQYRLDARDLLIFTSEVAIELRNAWIRGAIADYALDSRYDSSRTQVFQKQQAHIGVTVRERMARLARVVTRWVQREKRKYLDSLEEREQLRDRIVRQEEENLRLASLG